MGVVLTNKNNKEVRICYLGFDFIRKAIAHSFNEEVGNLYDKLYYGYKYTKEDNKFLDDKLPKYLDEFLYHSDCDGSFESENVKGIYEELKKLNPIFENENLKKKYDELLDLFKDGEKINLY